MSRQVPTETEAQTTWSKKLATLLARHKYAQAFRLLDKVIEDDLPLFRGRPEELEGRRMAWLCDRLKSLRDRIASMLEQCDDDDEESGQAAAR